MQLHPYLAFQGDCEDAFNTYKDVFGVEKFESVMRFSDLPKNESMPVEEAEKGKVMHMSLEISKGFKLMGSDVPAAAAGSFSKGSNTTIAVVLTDTVKAEEVFKKLSEGGEVLMPMAKMFWGSLYGKCKDKYGVHWQVDCALNEHKKQKTEEGSEAKADEVMETKDEAVEAMETKDETTTETKTEETTETKTEETGAPEATTDTAANGEAKTEQPNGS